MSGGPSKPDSAEPGQSQRRTSGLSDPAVRFPAVQFPAVQFTGLLATDGRVLHVNPTSLDSAGLTETEVQGKPLWETPWWSHSATLQSRLRKSVAQAAAGEADHFSATHAARDGRLIEIDFSLTPVSDDTGSVVGLVAEWSDIASRERVEDSLQRLNRDLERRVGQWIEELRNSEYRIRSILEAVGDAIITIDQRGKIISVNPATERMFGYSEDDLVGQNVSVLMPEPHCNEHDGYIARYLESREPHIIGIGREVVARRKDGSTFPVDLAVNEVDHLHVFTGIIRDISERVDLQRQVLEIAAQEQRRIGQELHDGTQQELIGLSLIAQNLVDTLNSKGDTFLEQHDLMAVRAVALRLLAGLGETSKGIQMMSRGLIPVEVDSCGLMNALDELASDIGQVQSATCKFHCDRPVELADNFMATHLYRIAQEAVTNALKHGDAKRIDISLAKSNRHVVLVVSDDGTGIDQHRANSAGRGLKIMGHRAGLMGATLQVGKSEGGGTVVTCTLPLV